MADSTVGQHTTAFLLDRIRGGDARAREALVARIEPLLRRFAHGRVPQLLRHQQDTADLVQVTWLKALDHIDAIEPREPGAFFAYLRAVLINSLRQSLRSHGRSPVVAGGEVAEIAESMLPAANVDPADWIAWEQALATLAPEHRGLLLMRFEFGMSFAEIAAETGESADGVRMKLNRAIARMAGAVHDDGAR
ncbi:MAG: sigma-70 family RNA polymerase sigma factor [Xanthomonadaceae bacterium]|jgi:RNA polymerase sigma-70 factor (ECF subfamily)|nr:sigma-70 family RNA polymerase sigma factor [Xanthomonadaceae bacterium]